MHVAAWVGTMAHALLSQTDLPSAPYRLRFDPTTPTEHQAQLQAQQIALIARELLDKHGFVVVEAEREVGENGMYGRFDLLTDHPDRGKAVIDLKTGFQMDTAWLQVGGYCSLVNQEGVHEVVIGGVLNVRRQPLDRIRNGTLELRPASALMESWHAQLARVDAVQRAQVTPLQRPGLHCRRCTVTDCAVRAK